MLEGCRSLREAESVIRAYVEGDKVPLLGEIPLLKTDIQFLVDKVNEFLRVDPVKATRKLTSETPICFSLFLVWQGIENYRDGDYWSRVHAVTGVSDIRYEGLWGRGFLKALRKHGLLMIEDDHGLPYVGPILFHGGVPDSCLPGYFRNVVWRDLVSKGTAGEDAVRSALEDWRQNAKRLGQLLKQTEEVEERAASDRATISRCDEYLQRTGQVEDQRDQLEKLEQIILLHQEILASQTRYDEIFERFREAERRRAGYSDEDRRILATAEEAGRYRAHVEVVDGRVSRIKGDMEAHQRDLDRLSQELFGCPWDKSLSEAVRSFDAQTCRRVFAQWESSAALLGEVRPGLYLEASLGGLMVVGTLVAGAVLGLGWSTGFLGVAGALMLARAIRRFKVHQRALAEAETSLKAHFSDLPGAEALQPRGEEAIAALEHLQRVLREVDMARDRLMEVWIQLNRLQGEAEDHEPRNGTATPLPREIATGDERMLPTDTSEALCAVEELLSDLRRRVGQWEAAIGEVDVRRVQAEEAERQSEGLKGCLEELEAEIGEKRTRRDSFVQALQGSGVPVDPEGAMKDIEQVAENLRMKMRQTEQRIAQLKAWLDPVIGQPISPAAVRDCRDHLARELVQLEAQRALTPDQLPILRDVESPARRFLLHGQEAAERFLLLSVRLLMESRDKGVPVKPEGWPATYRYDRVWQAFESWWDDEGRRIVCGNKQRQVKPHLVIWQEAGDWCVGIQVPEKFVDSPRLELLQDGEPLEVSARKEGVWFLKRLGGTVAVQATDGLHIALDVDSWRQTGQPVFLFRGWAGLSKSLRASRKPQGTSRLLVVVPEHWKKLPVGAPPEPVFRPGGYHAYHVDTAKDEEMSFLTPEGVVRVPLSRYRYFELAGNPLLGCVRDAPPLFVTDPPRLRCKDGQVLERVGYLELVPGGEVIEVPADWPLEGVPLPLAARSGWFELNVYDKTGEEIEAHEFRYISCLRQVRLSPDPLPIFPDYEARSHQPVAIEFDMDPEGEVSFAGPESLKSLLGRQPGPMFLIPSSPLGDLTRWEVRASGGEGVPIEIVVPRVWWCVGREDVPPGDDEWKAELLSLEEDWMSAVSDRALWLRCPRGAFSSELSVTLGVAERRYRMDRTSLVQIPLREFSDVIAATADQELWFTVRLRDNRDELNVGRVAVYRPPDRGEGECEFCRWESSDLPIEERGKSCSTCFFCRHHRTAYYCSSGEWTERLDVRDFQRRRADYVCSRWQGVYPGEPFDEWEELHLRGKRIRVTQEAGAIARGASGIVVGVAQGKARLRWDVEAAGGSQFALVCKFHYQSGQYLETLHGIDTARAS